MLTQNNNFGLDNTTNLLLCQLPTAAQQALYLQDLINDTNNQERKDLLAKVRDYIVNRMVRR